MNLITLKCPECGADLEIQDDREFIFCQYCGRKIYMNETNPDVILEKYRYKSLLARNQYKLEKQKESTNALFRLGKGALKAYILLIVLGIVLCLVVALLNKLGL